jgi:basic amino acid/polyamine antiporter, APA family
MNEEQGKKLNIWNIIGLGLGGAIGTGIFVLLGFGIAYTGRSIILVVAIGCLFMLLAYWYNLAMPTMFILKGGDYSMKTMLFNPLATGVGAWMTIVNGLAISSYAIAIATYLGIAIPALQGYQQITAFVTMTVFFLVTIRGSRFVTIIENLVTILLIFALALFVFFGIGKVDTGNFFSSTYDGGFFHGGFRGFIGAIAVMGWACQGTTMAPISMAAVTKKPKRTIPMAIIIITCILAVIYALIAFVAGGVLQYDQIAGVNLSITAEQIFPNSIYIFFIVGGGIGAIASSLLGGLAMFRYPLIQIAEDGWIPSVFKKTTKSGYPYLSYAVFYIISVFPIITGMGLDAVVSLVMIPTMLMNIYMNLACLTLPKKYPLQWEKRSVKIPAVAYKFCCVLGAFCAGVVAYNLFIALAPKDGLVAIIIVVTLVVASYIRLKQGAVNPEKLEKIKKAIVEEAIILDNE